MLRRLLTLGFAVSLLLSAATTFLWWRSNFISDDILKQFFWFHPASSSRMTLRGVSTQGRFSFVIEHNYIWKPAVVSLLPDGTDPRERELLRRNAEMQRTLIDQKFEYIKAAFDGEAKYQHWTSVSNLPKGQSRRPQVGPSQFRWKTYNFDADGSRGFRLTVGGEWWQPFTLLAILTLLTGGIFVRSRYRLKSNRCARCRYDLTGNTSGVCPECGVVVAGKDA